MGKCNIRIVILSPILLMRQNNSIILQRSVIFQLFFKRDWCIKYLQFFPKKAPLRFLYLYIVVQLFGFSQKHQRKGFRGIIDICWFWRNRNMITNGSETKVRTIWHFYFFFVNLKRLCAIHTSEIHHDLKIRHHQFSTIRFSTRLVNSLVSQMSSSNCDIGSMIVITVFILHHDFDIITGLLVFIFSTFNA